MSVQLGKRYTCQKCNTEVLCTKSGEGTPECCGQPMELNQTKVIPPSD